MDIAVAGAGISGLSAAWRLKRAGHKVVAFERNYKPGGRMNSRRKAGLVVDHGERFVNRHSPVIRELILDCGLHGELAAIDKPIYHMNEDGSFCESTPEEAVDLDRVTFPGGMLVLAEVLRRQVGGFNSIRVVRIDWNRETHKFTVVTEPPLRWAETQYDAVLVACPPPESLAITEPLHPLLNPAFVERASSVVYNPCFVAIAALRRLKLGRPMYGLVPPPSNALEWLAFEDQKCKGREVEGWSSLVAHGKAWSSERYLQMKEKEALEQMYDEARVLLPDLPREWRWARGKRWELARLKDEEQIVNIDEYPASPGDLAIEFAGDYRMGEGVENSAHSGRRAAEVLLEKISGSDD